jgi:hypothetical protein
MTVLSSDSWPNYYHPTKKTAKAWRSVSAESNLVHPSGWQIGGLIRSESNLSTSSDTVDAMALAALNTHPKDSRVFQLQAELKSWSGRGLQVKSPWHFLDSEKSWSMKIQGQWLQLTKLRQASGAGFINYSEATGYLSDINYSRNYHTNSSYFLPRADSNGVAGSLSFFLKKDLADESFVDLEALDLISKLKWNLVSESANFNSLATNDIPQGIQGVRKNMQYNQRMDQAFKFRWGQTFSESDSILRHGRWIAELNHRNTLNQAWLGWSTRNFSNDPTRATYGWAMSIAHDPLLGGTRAILSKSGAYLQYATDKLGKEAHVNSIQLGWQANF